MRMEYDNNGDSVLRRAVTRVTNSCMAVSGCVGCPMESMPRFMHSRNVVDLLRRRGVGALFACLTCVAPGLPAQDTSRTAEPPNAGPRAADVRGRPDVHETARFQLVLANRQFVIPNGVVSGLKIQPALGLLWRASRWIEMSADLQSVDNSGPGRQGPYLAQRALGDSAGSGNFLQELTLGVRLTRGEAGTRHGAARFELALSHARRSYSAVDPGDGTVVERGNRSEFVPSAEVAWMRDGLRIRYSVGVAWAGFPRDNAMYLRRLPADSTVAFGNTVGPTAQLGVSLWRNARIDARLFIPVTGNNTIDRESGAPVRTSVGEIGAIWPLSAALRARVFATNALGRAGALGLVADREYKALGGELEAAFGPRRRPAGGASGTPESHAGATERRDGSSLAVRTFAGPSMWGAVVQRDVVDGLRAAAFADLVSGVVDESEIGGVLRVRLLSISHTSERRTHLHLVTGASHTNNVFVNFLSGSGSAFVCSGRAKRSIRFGRESDADGELYLITLGATVEQTLNGDARIWATPLVTTAQRKGRQLSGLEVGSHAALGERTRVTATLGIPFSSGGNALTDDGRRRALVWDANLGWRLTPSVSVDVGVGNRLGGSLFHALRARSDGAAFRVGASFER